MNRLSKKAFISVSKSVLICFILMAAAAILPAAQCAYHLGGHDFDGGMARLMGAGPAPENPDGAGPNTGIRADTRINAIRNQLLMGSLTALICTLGAFLFLTKTVVAPIRQLFEITRIMAEGRLDVSAPPGPRNEIGRIGDTINELTVNLQEVLLHAWNHTIRVKALLCRISESLSDKPPHGPPRGIRTNVEDILREIEDLQALVRAFEFYDIHLEDDRIMAAETRNSHRPDDGRPRIGPESRPMRWDLENSN